MQKVHFITQGCSANVADSEIMQGLLKEQNYTLVDTPEEADLVVYNTCTVKGPTESKFKRTLADLEAKNKKVVLAGCIPQSERGKKTLGKCGNHSLVGTFQIKKIGEAVRETMAGNTVQLLQVEKEERLDLPRIRKNELIEIVPIGQGCKGSCTFCKTKQARGNLYSYRPRDIVRHISKTVEEGVQEIWLTSQDSSAYGLDIGTNMAELIKQIVAIPQNFRLRVGMSNPNFIPDFIDDLIEAYKDPKVFKFLHIPLQAGSDAVLQGMNREYTVDEYRIIVSRMKEAIPEITIATDIICGFPGETEEQFKETIRVVRETKPDVINLSRFWPRPGTSAARMKQLEGGVIKDRTQRMTRVFHEVARENNKEKWIGWKGTIFISEKGRGVENSWIGKNYCYKQVVVQSEENLMGKEVEVEVFDCTQFDLRGRILLQK